MRLLIEKTLARSGLRLPSYRKSVADEAMKLIEGHNVNKQLLSEWLNSIDFTGKANARGYFLACLKDALQMGMLEGEGEFEEVETVSVKRDDSKEDVLKGAEEWIQLILKVTGGHPYGSRYFDHRGRCRGTFFKGGFKYADGTEYILNGQMKLVEKPKEKDEERAQQ